MSGSFTSLDARRAAGDRRIHMVEHSAPDREDVFAGARHVRQLVRPRRTSAAPTGKARNTKSSSGWRARAPVASDGVERLRGRNVGAPERPLSTSGGSARNSPKVTCGASAEDRGSAPRRPLIRSNPLPNRVRCPGRRGHTDRPRARRPCRWEGWPCRRYGSGRSCFARYPSKSRP